MGFDKLESYLNAVEQYHGAIVGRVAGRIKQGSFLLNGNPVKLSINERFDNGAFNHLHGGKKGFSFKVWDGTKKVNERGEEAVSFEPGVTTYSILPYYTYYGACYSNWYPAVSTSDYYSHEKTYFMQSNFYDAASEEIMVAVQSKIFDPSSLRLFSKTYTYNMIKQLEKANIKKK